MQHLRGRRMMPAAAARPRRPADRGRGTRPHLALASAVVAAQVLLAACADAPVDGRPWASASGDAWVDMRLEVASGADLHIGGVGAVAFGRRGVVYVEDFRGPELLVLDSLLRPVATVGQRGEGPGEFLEMSTLQILPGDSLMVFDSRLSRMTVFSAERLDSGLTTTVPPLLSVSWLWRLPGPERRHMALDVQPFHAGDSGETDDERFDVLSILDETAQETAFDSVLLVPQPRSLVIRSGGNVMVGPHPYAAYNFFAVLPGGGFAYLSTDALAVTIVGVDGRQTEFSHPTIPLPVSSEHLDSILAESNPDRARVLRDGAPYTWPPVVGMIVDDRDRIWIGLREQPGETHREWAAFTRDGLHVASVRLPVAKLYPRAISGDKFLAVALDDLDVPTIRIYRILWDR